MRFLSKDFTFFKKYTINVVAFFWLLLTLLTAVSEIVRGPAAINNYQIFKNVFFHTIQQTNLYAAYPASYFDLNHYGIVFSLLIAPFALLPDWAGCLLWCMANAVVLYFVIMRMPVEYNKKIMVLAIALVEMLTSIHSTQFNPMVSAFIILPFILVPQKKEWAATFFIAFGILTKIYGIVALVSFLFSDNKMRFIGWFICWMILLFCLPMIISSPSFVVQSYTDWYHSIDEKNSVNGSLGIVIAQNISVHGMIQRILNLPALSQLWVLIPAAIFNLLPLLRIKSLSTRLFQLHYMAVCLLSVVIFSSSAESPTYIIAVSGVAIWFILSNSKNHWNIALLVFVILFTTLSSTDLFPHYIQRNLITKFALKALPCFIVWIVLIWKLLFYNFNENVADEDKQVKLV
jgi:hypothetical protein